MPSQIRKCIVCGGKGKLSLQYVKNGFHINRCAECGLMMVSPQPGTHELARIYDRSYFERGSKYLGNEDGRTRIQSLINENLRMEIVRRYLSKGRLLDVGCALGHFLEVSMDQGFDATGLEIAPFCADNIKERLGLSIKNCDLITARFPARSFDAITMWDVIEHVRSPDRDIAEANRILRENGFLFITTGDIGSMFARVSGRFWHLLTPPQHLFYFTPRSINKMLRENGFVLRKVFHLGKYVPLRFLIFKALETFGAIVSPLNLLIRSKRLADLKIHLNLYDIMTCVAQKVRQA
jgi:SAM-dependent methyltransferase